MNQVLVTGAPTDVELRYTPTGTPILNGRLHGKRQVGDREVFSTVGFTMFGKIAETLANQINDDKAYLLTGRLNYQQWENENGEKRSDLKVIADSLHALTTAEIIDGEYGPLLIDCTNSVRILGNLTRDIELRFTPNGASVANGSLAINEWNASKREQITHYVNFTAWEAAADAIQEGVKGDPIYIEGAYRLESWTTQDGTKKYQPKITAEIVTLLERGNRTAPMEKQAANKGQKGRQQTKSSSGGSRRASNQQARNTRNAALDIDEEFPPEEDLPF